MWSNVMPNLFPLLNLKSQVLESYTRYTSSIELSNPKGPNNSISKSISKKKKKTNKLFLHPMFIQHQRLLLLLLSFSCFKTLCILVYCVRKLSSNFFMHLLNKKKEEVWVLFHFFQREHRWMFTAHSMHILFIFLPTLSALLHHCGPRGHFYFLGIYRDRLYEFRNLI